MNVYTYWRLLDGNYVVAKNGYAIWEVKTRRQAIQDCKDLAEADRLETANA